ncbi:hypothetical protein [Allosphingosinicella sp.]|uniref:hypothetical protein n=1 Tax=Allosphingosinicella sp. TaxID=2823234 RepID=UPI002EF37FBB
MSGFPGAPKTLKGGFVEMDSEGRKVLRTITFQYNPDTLSRTLTPRSAKSDGGDRIEGLRLVGPPAETMKIDIELDATDRLERPDDNPETVANGIAPELADLEMMISPGSADLEAANRLASTGTIEVLPLPSPMLLLVLGSNRTLPVRINDFSVVEEAFDVNLNPIRARISLGLRLLSIDDLAYGSKGAELFMVALKRREQLSRRKPPAIQSLGVKTAP